MTPKRTAVVVGVGDERGLGARLARRFAREGYRVFAAGRIIDQLVRVAQDISGAGDDVVPVVADATNEQDLASLFDCADEDRSLDVVIFDAGESVRQASNGAPEHSFERVWRAAAFAGFLVGQEAARRLTSRRNGTVILTGAILDPSAETQPAALAAAKAALRSVAQSLAHDLRSSGVHAAHVIVDGGLGSDWAQQAMRLDRALPPDVEAVADICWNIHLEHRYAWTHELDVRPVRRSFRPIGPGTFNAEAGVQHGIAE